MKCVIQVLNVYLHGGVWGRVMHNLSSFSSPRRDVSQSRNRRSGVSRKQLLKGFSFPGGTNPLLFLQVLLFTLSREPKKKKQKMLVAGTPWSPPGSGFKSLQCLCFKSLFNPALERDAVCSVTEAAQKCSA